MAKELKDLKILQLTAENIKKLKVVQIRPDGNLVQITGPNDQGKTSVLDAIWWALGGTAAIQSDPIRHGADKAVIKLDMGEIVVTRKFSRKDEGPEFTTSLTVESADGSRFPSPQTMLDQMLGALSFDPLAFTRMKPEEQFAALKIFVPGFDFDDYEKKNKADYAKRTDENRQGKELRAQAAGISVEKKVEPVDVADLVAQLEEAGQVNARLEKRRANREAVAKDIEIYRERASGIDKKIEDVQKVLADLRLERDNLNNRTIELAEKLAKAEPLPEPVDTAALTVAIGNANAQNEQARQYAQKADLIARARQHETAAQALTEAMDARLAHKEATIAAAALPVPGLSLGDGAVLLNGTPFDQAADAIQLRTSVALAMAANPKIRVIRVKDGSLLDENNLKLLAEMADANNCQVWLEKVSSDGKVGIVLEDGMVKQ